MDTDILKPKYQPGDYVSWIPPWHQRTGQDGDNEIFARIVEFSPQWSKYDPNKRQQLVAGYKVRFVRSKSGMTFGWIEEVNINRIVFDDELAWYILTK